MSDLRPEGSGGVQRLRKLPLMRGGLLLAMVGLVLFARTPWIVPAASTPWFLPDPGYLVILPVALYLFSMAYLGVTLCLRSMGLSYRALWLVDVPLCALAGLVFLYAAGLYYYGSKDPYTRAARFSWEEKQSEEKSCAAALKHPLLSERTRVLQGLKIPVEAGCSPSCAELKLEMALHDQGRCPTVLPTEVDCLCGSERLVAGRLPACTGQIICSQAVAAEDAHPACELDLAHHEIELRKAALRAAEWDLDCDQVDFDRLTSASSFTNHAAVPPGQEHSSMDLHARGCGKDAVYDVHCRGDGLTLTCQADQLVRYEVEAEAALQAHLGSECADLKIWRDLNLVKLPPRTWLGALPFRAQGCGVDAVYVVDCYRFNPADGSRICTIKPVE